MSAARQKPSSVDALRRGMATQAVRADDSIGQQENIGALTPERRLRSEKPARITLNLPPALYRQLTRWADATAEQLDVPRVPVQDALRAMIHAVTVDDVCGGVVADLLRRELAD